MNVAPETSKKKICFVALNIYWCLSRKYPSARIGGAELQQLFIGEGLRDRGYDVSFITIDYGPPQIESIDGLTVYKTFKEKEGLFGIRFLYPKLFKIWKAMRQANAGIYYTRTAGFLPGILCIFCKTHGKKLMFASSSDANFIPKTLNLPTLRDKILYYYGLKRATAIIVQSNVQKLLLWENFGLKGIVIPNFLRYKAEPVQNKDKKHVLWVSTIRDMKRPMQFIRLAQIFPNEQFIMIGGPEGRNHKLFEDIKRESAPLKNLEFLGFQSFERTEGYFDKCKVFVNTSVYEGFPNTFLQAWRRGIPVISYVDPDRIIQNNKLGAVVRSELSLREALRSFLENPLCDPSSVMKYFTEHHSYTVIDRYCTLLEAI